MSRDVDRRTFVKGAGAALGAAAASGQASASVDDGLDTDTAALQEVIVVFDSRDAVDRLGELSLAEGYYKFKQFPFGYTKLTGAQLMQVASWSETVYLQDNHTIELHNDDSRDVTGVQAVQQELFYTGESVHAVVIDSGIDGDHPDFEETLRHNFRFVNPLETEMWRDVGPADTASKGHGTHVSGTVTGEGNRNPEYEGMAPDADLTVYSTDIGAGLLGIVGAYDDLVDRQRKGIHDVQVVNNSYGASAGNAYNPTGALQRATWAAYKEGILSVFSAGNSGPGTNTMGDYASGPHVMSSAATNDETKVTEFSSRGRKPGYSEDADGANYDRNEALQQVEAYYASDFTGSDRELNGGSRSGVLGPAGLGLSPVDPGVRPPNTAATGSVFEKIEPDPGAGFLVVNVGWDPNGADNDVYLRKGSKGGKIVASSTGFVNANPETIRTQVEDDTTYYIELRPFANGVAQYQVDFQFYAVDDSEIPDRPYGVHRPAVGTPGKLIMSTLSPDDAWQAYAGAIAGSTSAQAEAAQNPFYGALSGTSMSGPCLTGICALVYDAYFQTHGEFPDPIDVINTIEAEAVHTREDHRVYSIGAGFADALSAVERAEEGNMAGFDEVDLAREGDATTEFVVTGSRDGGSDAFTPGDTAGVAITVDADGPVTVRDRVPFDWELVGGDHDRVFTEDGERYVEFTDVTADTVRYFAEAPSSPGEYVFGPAEASPSGRDDFLTITGTDANAVVPDGGAS